MSENRFEIISIILMIIQTFIGFIGIQQGNTILLIMSIILAIAIIIICIFILRIKKTYYKYTLIQYLFHNDGVNRFNIVPKLLLMMDKEQKYNNIEIDRVETCYDVYYENNQYNSKVEWNMSNVHNKSKDDFSEYYFYTGTENGGCEYQKLTLHIGNEFFKYSIQNYLERNRIKLLTWSFPERFKAKSTINGMDLSVFVNGIFDFNKNQVIYFVPRNFGCKINYFNISVIMHFKHKEFDMELREIGRVKGKKGIAERILAYHHKKEDGDKVTYFFEVEQKNVNINNVYYIFIKPRS